MTTGGGGGNVVYKYNIYYTNMVVVYWSPGKNHIPIYMRRYVACTLPVRASSVCSRVLYTYLYVRTI